MSEIDLLAEEKPQTITLGDGKEYKLPPLHLTTFANMEKTMGIGLGAARGRLEAEPATIGRLITYALLKEANPKMTLQKAGELVTVEVMENLTEVLGKVLTI